MLRVHAHDDVARAKAALPPDVNPRFITAPDAAQFLGLGYVQVMQRALAPWVLCVGCGQDAALAHEALRLGFAHVYADVPPPMAAKLAAIAAALGSIFTADYPAGVVDMQSLSSLQDYKPNAE